MRRFGRNGDLRRGSKGRSVRNQGVKLDFVTSQDYFEMVSGCRSKVSIPVCKFVLQQTSEVVWFERVKLLELIFSIECKIDHHPTYVAWNFRNQLNVANGFLSVLKFPSEAPAQGKPQYGLIGKLSSIGFCPVCPRQADPTCSARSRKGDSCQSRGARSPSRDMRHN